MTATISYTGELVVTSCWCGIRYAAPSSLEKAARSNPKMAVYCPLGHEGFYAKSDTDVERERRERAEAQIIHLRDQLEATKRQHAATKGQLTKTRKRAAAALCPVQGCGRSFVQMQRHLDTVHPGFVRDHEVQS